MNKSTQFRKNFIWNIFGTGLNAFTSLFFLIVATRINGIDEAGIFTIAFSTACILYVIGIYAGRIYQVTEPNKEITDKDYIVNRIISIVLMIVLVVFFCIIRKYSFIKSIIFLLLTVYKGIEALSECIYAILQKNEKLEIVGKSLFIKALLSILTFTITDFITKNLIISIAAIIIIWIIILCFYDIKKTEKYMDYSKKVNWENVWKIFKSGFFTFAIAFMGLYLLNAPKYSIDTYLENNYQTIFGIIVMPATVIGLVAQFLIHPYLNQILKLYELKDLKGLKKIISKFTLTIFVGGILASFLAYFLGPEVLGYIYGIELGIYRISLLIIIIAATLYTIGIIYSSILTTVRERFSQFIIYVSLSIFAIVISNFYTKNLQINGAVKAYFLIMALQFMIYAIYTNIRLKTIFKSDRK